MIISQQDQARAWLITPLHYGNESQNKKSNDRLSANKKRQASNGRNWKSNHKGTKTKQSGHVSWKECTFRLECSEKKLYDNWTMIEYTPADQLKVHNLCILVYAISCTC
jgi:hypothetical protein